MVEHARWRSHADARKTKFAHPNSSPLGRLLRGRGQGEIRMSPWRQQDARTDPGRPAVGLAPKRRSAKRSCDGSYPMPCAVARCVSQISGDRSFIGIDALPLVRMEVSGGIFGLCFWADGLQVVPDA